MVRMSFFLVFISLLGCKQPESIFENANSSCVLKLYADGKYSYKFPVFIGGPAKENGTYVKTEDQIILTRKEKNDIDDVRLSFLYSVDNPSHINIEFMELERRPIDVKFQINESKELYQTDSGQIKLPYSQLEERGVISINGRIESLKIYLDDLIFIQDTINKNDLRRPDGLHLRVNPYKNQKTLMRKRFYEVKNDSILLNDIDPKVIGISNRLLIRKQ